jgi:thiamine biosynthesis lipoprotein ApbE
MPGARAGLLSLNGNMFAWGTPPDAEAWRVELVYAGLDLKNRAVSSLGDWSFPWRGDEFRPGRSDTIAVTVIADAGVEADALADAFLAAGSQKTGLILERSRRIEAILLVGTAAGPTLIASGSLQGLLELDPEFENLIGGRVRFILPPSAL